MLSTQRVNRAVLPYMRKRGLGLIVWVSSTSTRGGTPPYLSPYFAAKAAMDSLAVSYAGSPADVARAVEYNDGPYAGVPERLGSTLSWIGIRIGMITKAIIGSLKWPFSRGIVVSKPAAGTMLSITLNPTSEVPLFQQLYSQIRDGILGGGLPRGRQGRGVASALLQAAEAEARSQHRMRVTLDTTEPLTHAMGFYERHGFTRSGRVSDFFGMALHEWVKWLRSS